MDKNDQKTSNLPILLEELFIKFEFNIQFQTKENLIFLERT